LAYYDIPPPSPPPAGPLPSVPPPGSYPQQRNERNRSLSGSSSSIGAVPPLTRPMRSTSGSKLTSSPSEQGLYSQPIPTLHRGKEAAFPARPILPPGMVPSGNGTHSSANGEGGKRAPVGTGLEATLRVPRYRELYALALPEDAEYEKRRKAFERMGGDEVGRIEGGEKHGMAASELNKDYEDLDEDEIQDVLARFKESRLSHDRQRSQQDNGQALGRSRSFEALKTSEHHSDFGVDEMAELSDEEDLPIALPKRRIKPSRTSDDYDDDDEQDRNSRWTESLYSRASFLDPDKSEEARDRFVQRVTEMFGENGRERDTVPPVPKLPAAYAVDASTKPSVGRSWLKF